MSSLEERREARRRKRMQEEGGDSNRSDLVNLSVGDEQIRMAHKRQVKEDRLSRLAAEVNSFNEEDDYERKRRERREAREARLRMASEPVEEETSRRPRKRQQDEEPAPEPQEDARRSRRRRGGDDREDEAAAEERRQKAAKEAAANAAAAEAAAAAAAADEEKRRRENEARQQKEAEERERREAEEAKRKIEEDKQASENAVKRKAEEEKQKKEEGERQKREAEERRKRINETYKHLVTDETSDSCEPFSYPFNIERDVTYGQDDEDDGDDEKDDDDDDYECDSDFEEGPEKSDTSLELQNHNGNSDDYSNQKTNPFCSPVKDIFESFAEIRVSNANPLADSGQLSAAILNDLYPMVAIDDYTYKTSNLSETRESTLPDFGKFSSLSFYANHLEPVSWLKDPKQPDYQTNKKHGIPEKNLIPSRGSNLKDIQKKFEAVSKQEPKEFGKRNINLHENGLISSLKAPSRPLINGVSIKDYKSKLEGSLSDSRTKFQSFHNKLSTESGVKNTSILEDLNNSKEKILSYNNNNNPYYSNNNNIINKNNNNNNSNSGLRITEKTVKICNKWPPEKATRVNDISKQYSPETNSFLHCESEEKPAVLISQKSVVKRWPHAQTAQISMVKRPEKLTSWSSGVNEKESIAQQMDYKRDVRGRWPPEADLKQTARESISSALAQKIYKPPSNDVTDASSQNLRKDIINETAVAQVFLQTPENTQLKEGTSTCKVMPKLKENNQLNIPHDSCHNGHPLQTGISPLTNLHAVKEQSLSYTSFVPTTNQHQINDDDEDDDDSSNEAISPSISSTHCVIQLQCGKNEEEEREEAERKKRQEEAARRRHEEEEKKKKGKRKGLGGLSPEKKKLLKKIIMQKAAEDLKNEAKRKAEEKDRFISERVEPLVTDGLNEAQLQDLVKKLHSKMAELEEEVYDWEFKIRRQEFEINDLTMKVNDTRGKFVKPVLRKVSKTEAKLAKLERKRAENFRTTLKSTHESQKEDEGQAEE